MERSKQLNPIVVGMGVTMKVGTDRYVYTIINVNNSKKQIKIQQDICKRIDSNGQSDQTYEYYNNANGKIIVLSLRKNLEKHQNKIHVDMILVQEVVIRIQISNY